jgi:hypothetical protein
MNAKITSIVHTGQSLGAGSEVIIADGLATGRPLSSPGTISSLIAGLGMLDYFRRTFLGCTG